MDVVFIYSELIALSMWAHNYKVKTQKSFRNDNREGGNYLTYFEEFAKQSNNNPGDDYVCNTISALLIGHHIKTKFHEKILTNGE